MGKVLREESVGSEQIPQKAPPTPHHPLPQLTPSLGLSSCYPSRSDMWVPREGNEQEFGLSLFLASPTPQCPILSAREGVLAGRGALQAQSYEHPSFWGDSCFVAVIAPEMPSSQLTRVSASAHFAVRPRILPAGKRPLHG